MSNKVRIAVFASGAGTNANRLIEYFNQGEGAGAAEISLVISNKAGAGVLDVAARHSVKSVIISRDRFFDGDGYLPLLLDHHIKLLVLAGFLWKIPETLIHAYPNAIVNIHPALLPKYGGKGMYGLHVHKAVIDNKEKESGITIHYVDGHYDNGDIIFQAKCPVLSGDTPEVIAAKVHELEYRYYPEVVRKIAVGLN